MSKLCQTCQKTIIGRSDKLFCSVPCKNQNHTEKRRNTRDIVREIDGWLHRNREILATIMGKSKKEMLDKQVLTRTGFKFEYLRAFILIK